MLKNNRINPAIDGCKHLPSTAINDSEDVQYAHLLMAHNFDLINYVHLLEFLEEIGYLGCKEYFKSFGSSHQTKY